MPGSEGAITAEAATCALHSSHSPEPLTIEQHHVCPVGWQHTWQPAVAPFPGRDPDGRGELWDDRTIPVAPTCHKDIHFWIVALMHAIEAQGGENIDAAAAAVRSADSRARGPQFEWALEALRRFQAVGGLLQDLVAAKEWGEA